MKNVLRPLPKGVLIPLALTAPASATDAAIQKKIFGSCTRLSDLPKQIRLTTLNEEMNNIMKIVRSRKESGLLMKGVSETIKNEAKVQIEKSSLSEILFIYLNM